LPGGCFSAADERGDDAAYPCVGGNELYRDSTAGDSVDCGQVSLSLEHLATIDKNAGILIFVVIDQYSKVWTMNFKPVRSTSLHQEIYEELVNAIVSGNLHPGEKLTLESVAAQFEVSTMPVRESFRKLEAAKLVRKEKNRGITVNKLSIDNIDEIIEIRLLLEPYAAKSALKFMTDKIIEELNALSNSINKAISPEEYLQKNREFHFLIYKTSKNEILAEIIEGLWERYSPYLYILHRTEIKFPSQM